MARPKDHSQGTERDLALELRAVIAANSLNRGRFERSRIEELRRNRDSGEFAQDIDLAQAQGMHPDLLEMLRDRSNRENSADRTHPLAGSDGIHVVRPDEALVEHRAQFALRAGMRQGLNKAATDNESILTEMLSIEMKRVRVPEESR